MLKSKSIKGIIFSNLKLYNVLLFIISIFSIFSWFIMILNSFPQADDFGFNMNAYHTWISTKSLIEVYISIVKEVLYNFNNWAGSYSTIFINASSFMIYNLDFHRVQLLFVFLIFLISIHMFLKLVISRFYGNANSATIFSSILFIVFLNFYPINWLSEVLTWYSAAAGYSIPIMIFFILISLLLKKQLNIYDNLFAILLTIVLAGSHINSSMFFFYVLSIISGIYTWQRFKNSERFSFLHIVYIVYFVYIIFFAINILAPGNYTRLSIVSGSSDILEKDLIQSLKYTLYLGNEFALHYFLPNTIYTFFIVFFIVSKKMKVILVQSINEKIVYSILLLSVFYFSFFSWAYSVGYHQPSDRIYFSSTIFLLVALFIFLSIWSNEITIMFSNSSVKIFSFVALLLVFFYSDIETNSVVNYVRMIDGSVNNYRQVMESNFNNLVSLKKTVIIIRPFCPEGIHETIISIDPDYWKNVGIARYYQKKILIRDE